MAAISITAVMAALAVMDVRVLMTSNAVRATIFLVGLSSCIECNDHNGSYDVTDLLARITVMALMAIMASMVVMTIIAVMILIVV